MSNQQRLRKLKRAENLVRQVANSMRGEKSVCDCCGLTVYSDMNEYQMQETLRGALTRLTRTQERLTVPSEA